MRGFRVLVAILCVVAVALAGGVFGAPGQTEASSHREAPFISLDQPADATDLYAFVSPDRPDTVTLLANYIPFQIPASGPNFYRFGDDVLYEINVDNNGDARDDLSFQFRFRTVFNNGDTFLFNTGPITALDDPDLNQEQFYSLSMLEGDAHTTPQRQGRVVADNLQVAPYNVGPQSYPNGYRTVANQAIYQLDNGIKVFTGPRDDPFFVDLGGAFDLLQFRALQGLPPVDDLAGLNVHTLAVQVPMTMLTRNRAMPSGAADPNAIIGVRTTAYRQTTSVLRQIGTADKDGGAFPSPRTSEGPWVQISRLDNPLVNEVVIPLRDKDRWNGSVPMNDAQFLRYVQDPELARLLNGILGVDVPPTPRADLVAIFLTGIPDLNQPANVTPSSQLRLNLAIPPAANPNRLGLLGGDTSGFPNGRRPADDVVDIELRAVAGATPFTPNFNRAPNNTLGDMVNANDVAFLTGFPFLNAPHDYAGASYRASGMPNTGAGGAVKTTPRRR